MLRLKEWIRPILVLTSGIAVLIGGIELYFKMGMPNPDPKTSPPHPIAIAPHREVPPDPSDSNRTIAAETAHATAHSTQESQTHSPDHKPMEQAQNHAENKSWSPKDLDEPVAKGVKKIKDSVASLIMKVPLKTSHDTPVPTHSGEHPSNHTETTAATSEASHLESVAKNDGHDADGLPKSHAIEEVVDRSIAQSLYPVAPISSTPLPSPVANASPSALTPQMAAAQSTGLQGFISESELAGLFSKQTDKDLCQTIEVRGSGYRDPQGTSLSADDWKKVMDLFHESKELLRNWLKNSKKDLLTDSIIQFMNQQLDALVMMRPPSVEEPDLNWRGIGVLTHNDPAHPTIRVSNAFVKMALANTARGKFEIARLVAQVWSPCEMARSNLTAPWDPLLMCLGVPLAMGCASGTYSEPGWAVSTTLAAVIAPPGCKIPAFEGPGKDKCLNLYSTSNEPTLSQHLAPVAPSPSPAPPAHRSHMPSEEKDFEPTKGHH